MTRSASPAQLLHAQDEKLRMITELFGPAMAERLGGNGGKGPDTPPPDRSDNPASAAQLRARLIDHLQTRLGREDTQPGSAATSKAVSAQKPKTPVLDRIRQAASLEALADEHPAVIAKVLQPEPHPVRVSILRRLPGKTARHVMQRIRTP